MQCRTVHHRTSLCDNTSQFNSVMTRACAVEATFRLTPHSGWSAPVLCRALVHSEPPLVLITSASWSVLSWTGSLHCNTWCPSSISPITVPSFSICAPIVPDVISGLQSWRFMLKHPHRPSTLNYSVRVLPSLLTPGQQTLAKITVQWECIQFLPGTF